MSTTMESPQLRTPSPNKTDEECLIGGSPGHKRMSVLSSVDSRVTIAAVNLTYTVPIGKEKRGCLPKSDAELKQPREKIILDNVTALFRPGRLTAVMGASGAGKTSLLYVMAGEQNVSGRLSGRVLVNGEAWEGKRVKDISGFVFQEDVLLDTMTVNEAIWMSATLRLTDVSGNERRERVDDLLEILKIKECQNTRIGSPQDKGVSGGERKRCAIAMELITNPAVLFLDEPTSGLDTRTAYNVVATLQELAHKHGRTVIATIHQPSSDIFHLFDDLLILGDGRVLYSGPAGKAAVEYFGARGYPCPQYTNPADYFFMHVPPGAELAAAWASSQEASALEATIQKERSKPAGVPGTVIKRKAPLTTQFAFLLARTTRNAWRNKMILQVKLLQNIMVGLLVGLIYYDTNSKAVPTQVQNRNGALYFIVVGQFFGASMGFVSVFSQEKAVFLREYGAGYYSIIPYFLGKILVEFPVQVICPVVLVVICYYMIGLQPAFLRFFQACTIAVATALSGMAVGTVAGAAFSDISMALVVLPLVLLPLMMFSGLIVNIGSLPLYFAWIQWVSPMRYAYSALMKNEYQDLVFQNCDPRGEPCAGELVLTQMSMDGGLTIWENIVTLLGIYAILMIAGFAALAFISRRRR